MRSGARLLELAAGLAALATTFSARAEQPPLEPRVHPTPLWAAMQVIPSPTWTVTERALHFGARWQVTPVLYSYRMQPGLTGLRTLVVEPSVRHRGSSELFLSPEYIAARRDFAQNWLLRWGVRSYFPLLQRGEYLSVSLGGSGFLFQERVGAALEAGVYTLFGVLGVQLTHSPTPNLRSTQLTLSIRYF